MTALRILVIGATGYIGSHLVPRLLEAGHQVRCLVRSRARTEREDWFSRVEIFEGDVLKPETLQPAFKDIDLVYYLVHSMATPDGDFAELDRIAAENTGRACLAEGVKRIVYLGGLGKRGPEQSLHLKSRHEVGDVLRDSGVPVTEFRAAVIVGAGSLSFEMIHHLANRLPFMICPRWVFTRTQPIAVDDVLHYLTAAARIPQSSGRIIDIGGPEILTYRDMMLTVARVLRLKRRLLEVPVLTPRLSSYWVGLVTPVPVKPARALIEGLRYETIRENALADSIFDIEPRPFEQAVRNALLAVLPETGLADPVTTTSIVAGIEPSHLLTNEKLVDVDVPAGRVFNLIAAVGGDNGWFYADWVWKLRGWVDELIGGVGLRRGRRHPTETSVGEPLDFWRVEELQPGQRILLRAEMKVPGRAWLEFEVSPIEPDRCRIRQTARFYPRGLTGILYWYLLYLPHAIVFQGMIGAIAARAHSLKTSQ